MGVPLAGGKKKPPTLLGPGVPDPPACLANISILFQSARLSARLLAYSANNLFVLHNIDFLSLRRIRFRHVDQNLFVLIHAPFGGPVCQLDKPLVSCDPNCQGLLRVNLNRSNQIIIIIIHAPRRARPSIDRSICTAISQGQCQSLGQDIFYFNTRPIKGR